MCREFILCGTLWESDVLHRTPELTYLDVIRALLEEEQFTT
jgi:hypothetical protein